ncbi:2-hexaprenyl-6-methoxy-1,4-benzoquinone methyltransferase [Phlyctochytrium bullatum]|nr:2-hexaprenyl-6-methoxy-1,4-benzoquinone methyltransferase [Phlyctochytrium bullatum]
MPLRTITRSLSTTPRLRSERTTHFGFKTVAEEQKESLVGQVFKNVASKYDVMNDFMSAGVHRLWKDHFIRKLSPGPTTKLLDVAGGTGDIAFRFLDYVRAAYGPANQASVQVVDINPAMLEVGERRASELGYLSTGQISFAEGNAEKLEFVEDNSVDAYTIAFGIRNCTHVDKVIAEAYRVLKPGGRFMVLEFGRVNTPGLSNLYDLYSFNVIPAIGGLVANDRDSYQYLVESIRKFPPQPEFARMIEDAGFLVPEPAWEDLTFGVAAIHSGFKVPITSIRIPRAEVRENPSRHVVFQISVTGPVRAWTVYRRYSEFESLNASWLALFPHAPPPYPLPPKNIISFFGFTTSSDPAKIDERRRGLEQYLMAVLEARDERWRKSKEWADFLGVPDSARRATFPGKTAPTAPGVLDSPDAWMDEYRRLQALGREIRTIASARDRFSASGDIVSAQSSIIQGKKALSSLQAGIDALLEFLKQSERAFEKEKANPTRLSLSMTKGEIDRRRDLILNLQSEQERLATLFTHSFTNTSAYETRSTPSSPSAKASANANATTAKPAPATIGSRSGRRFGNIAAMETEVTRNLDNNGLLQLQKTTMVEQDESLEVLSKIVKRQHQIGLAIGQELDLQNQMLEELDQNVDKVSENLKHSSRKLDYVTGKK